jgi:hypothetical protein
MLKNYKWNYNTLNQLHVELSTYCNAGCPLCPRTLRLEDGSSLPQARPDLILESITIENFKKWFPPDFMKQVNHWIFCGTHGDPMMNKDVLDIMRYVCEYENTIFINTNGGMRDVEFWSELGIIFSSNSSHKKERQITFSLDGLWDTNHLYRRNIPFTKAIENAKAFIDAGGVASWDFLIFKHNEHQLEDARKLAFELGFKYFVPKKALGFQNVDNNHIEKRHTISGKVCRDKEGKIEYTIEPPSFENVNFVGDIKTLKVVHPESELKVNISSIIEEMKHKNNSREFIENKYNQTLKNYTLREEEKCTDVVCKSHIGTDTHEIYIDAYGNVFPCCYVGVAYTGNFLTMSGMQINLSLKNYGVEKVSLKNYSLKEIINNGYLQHTFEDSWGKTFEEGGLLYCNETCGHKSNIDKIYTHDLVQLDNKKIQTTIKELRTNI